MPHLTSAEAAVEDLFAGMTALTRALRSAAHRWPVETGGVRRSDVTLLRSLADGECRSTDLAARLGLAPSVISRQLAALERDELICRRPDPDDGRAGLVALTDTGRTRLIEIRRRYVELLQEHLGDWNEDRIRLAVTILDDLADVLIGVPDATPDRPTDRPTDNTAPPKETA